LHNEVLNNLTKYYRGDQIKKRWVGHVACMVEIRNSHRILVEKPEC